ncbi:hypothetical protein [Rhodococcoides kroppenstedtii]|uniref:hypothetical protein n=1 Tax=Rhodococcoides kroppenstedtii TaxID=293050 RepID=UPI0036317ADB
MAVVAAAIAVGTAGPAAAEEYRPYTMIPGHTYTLGEFDGVQCAGQMTSGIQTPDYRPGVAIVTTTFYPFFTAPCAVEMQVNWQNLDTGERGTATSRVVTYTRSSFQPSVATGDIVEIATKPGRVLFTVATGSLHYVAVPPVEAVVPG